MKNNVLCPARVQVRSDPDQDGSSRVCDGERDFSGAGSVIQEQSQLEPPTQQSRAPRQHQGGYFPGVPSNVSHFPSGAGRASVSIYSVIMLFAPLSEHGSDAGLQNKTVY